MDGLNTKLTPRYEVRKLELEDLPWAMAVLLHSAFLYNTLWSVIYTEDVTKRIYEALEKNEYIARHQIESGLSYGVFDLEYQYKRPESALTGGKLYWDVTNTEATPKELLDQMDFPLVSVALSYDATNPFDPEKVKPVLAIRPLYGVVVTQLRAGDKRDPKSWMPKSPGEVLLRNGTSTRIDYSKQGLMKLMAHWLMHDAAARGYRAIQIECASDSVHHVWMNPPEPYKAELISSLDTGAYEETVEGKKIKPFAPSRQLLTKVYVTLKAPPSQGP
ncbi:hypothetical protein GQ53DRAFT_683261 [Thozetella sp. PMI_491]|nr:hypothetical protein GQ53DRAFT_683261 [Thozetella sp. PMI_491]